jgi:hypothetical protein
MLGVVLGILILQGCGTLTKPDPEDLVKERIGAYWQAMIDKDYEKAYSYLSPGFRLKVDKFIYRNRFFNKTDYHAAVVKTLKCENDRCEAMMDLNYTVLGVPPYGFKLDRVEQRSELWVLADDQWWLLPKR